MCPLYGRCIISLLVTSLVNGDSTGMSPPGECNREVPLVLVMLTRKLQSKDFALTHC